MIGTETVEQDGHASFFWQGLAGMSGWRAGSGNHKAKFSLPFSFDKSARVLAADKWRWLAENRKRTASGFGGSLSRHNRLILILWPMTVQPPDGQCAE